MLRFTKMNGAGNDFILIDNRTGDVDLNRSQIARLCDRHRGIGADGVLLLENPSAHADFRMRYFNADGGEAEMCGNGARCFARFANRVAGTEGKISFETPAGVISAELAGDLVTLQMTDPTDLRLSVPLRVGTEKESFISLIAACRMLLFRSHKSAMSMCWEKAQRFVITKCFRQTAQT